MKKKLKIRFVDIYNRDYYHIQRKTWFGWKYFTRLEEIGYDNIKVRYCGEDQMQLLERVLKEKYKTVVDYCDITIYPEITKL